MSIPITMRAIRKRLASMKPPAPPICEPVPDLKAERSPSTPSHHAQESIPATLPSALFSPEPMEEDGLPSPPGRYVMSVAAGPAVDGANTDAVANPSPCASVGVYSHWVASSLPAELI